MPQQNTYSAEGKKNLLNVEKAGGFTDWMWGEIKPYLSGNILELGSGMGTYSEKVVRDFTESKVIVSEIDHDYIKSLESKFKPNKNVFVKNIDLNNQECFKEIDTKINTVFALNVLEHIGDDVKALNYIYDILEPGGKLVFLVPAHKFLFNSVDRAVGHYRRYSRKTVKDKVQQTKFKLGKMFYFNFAGIPGWFVSGNILKKQVINESALGFFNTLVPVFKFVGKYVFFRSIGISLIVVLAK